MSLYATLSVELTMTSKSRLIHGAPNTYMVYMAVYNFGSPCIYIMFDMGGPINTYCSLIAHARNVLAHAPEEMFLLFVNLTQNNVKLLE